MKLPAGEASLPQMSKPPLGLQKARDGAEAEPGLGQATPNAEGPDSNISCAFLDTDIIQSSVMMIPNSIYLWSGARFMLKTASQNRWPGVQAIPCSGCGSKHRR